MKMSLTYTLSKVYKRKAKPVSTKKLVALCA